MSNNKEMEQQKKIFKENIELLINNGEIEQSKDLIRQFETLAPYDADIWSMKAIILFIEGKYDEAEDLLWKGVDLDNKNKDILYNLGYLYEVRGEFRTAINLYWMVMKITDDFQQISSIKSTIKKLKMMDDTTEKKFIVLGSREWSEVMNRPQLIAQSLSRLAFQVEYIQPLIDVSIERPTLENSEMMKYSQHNMRRLGFLNVHIPISVYHNGGFLSDNYLDMIQGLIDLSDEEIVIICCLPAHATVLNKLTGSFKIIYDCPDEEELETLYIKKKNNIEDHAVLLEKSNIITTNDAGSFLVNRLGIYKNVYLIENGDNSENDRENNIFSGKALSLNSWSSKSKELLSMINGHADNLEIGIIRERYEGLLKNKPNPTLSSLYALTFAGTETDKFYGLAKRAYDELQTASTLKNYIFASVEANRINECAETIINDSKLTEIDKAEIEFLIRNDRSNLLKSRLLHIAKWFRELRNMISELEKGDLFEYNYILGNYYYENGYYNQSIMIYDKLLNHNNNILNSSPTLYHNMANSLIEEGRIIESRKYAKKVTMSQEHLKFSIVIPTRNNHMTLEYTLKTCLDQEFDNYEIVVSDNSSNDSTCNLVASINNDKIKYFRTEQELAMTENFNFAISKAKGEYIIVLGSDDGLLLHALSTLDILLDTLDTKILKWDYVFYGWPDVKLGGVENYFNIPKTITGSINRTVIKSKDIINNVVDFNIPYNSLPMLYCNAVVHRDLIDKLKTITGTVFAGTIPDVYSGFALACIQEHFIAVDVPMSIGGASGKSNGIAVLHGNKDKESKGIQKDFNKLNNKLGATRFKIVPDIPNVVAPIAESFLNVKQLLGDFSADYILNRQKMIQICVESLDVTDKDFQKHLQIIYSSLEDDQGLKEWFVKNYIEKSGFGRSGKTPMKFQKGFTYNGGLTLDLSDFNVTDVYGAANIFRKITGW
ncbi:glycosyltransferase [Paenibacillus polymyxa]|uniref:HyaD n=1 Tax=Paenibacillus polymyxa (strain SC2) TaxID=886882 RepID=E3EBM7_PAEPS|nr:glycosyltransferase [Paenibacillus polymyxa]ADO58845.1 hyaD [Paenibacillus polymyxa SC2]WPQ56450.1 glycosyltransferase [Paenibacillus polymyxa]CCI71376.1 Hyaluronan synthase [Paenibacillus polymyxa M1]